MRRLRVARAVLAGCLASGAAGAQNLLPNPDFAVGLQDWVALSGTFTLDTSIGTPAPSVHGQAPSDALLRSGCVPIEPSQRYRLQARCRIPPGQATGGSCVLALATGQTTECFASLPKASTYASPPPGLWVTLENVFSNRAARGLQVGLGLLPAQPVVGEFEVNLDSANVDRLTKGDFNRDDRTDLLLRNGSNLTVWIMNGTQLLAEQAVTPGLPAFAGWSVATTDDFNQDGATDLVVRNALLGQTSIWYLDGTERSGVFPLSYALDPPWQIVASADFDKNGFPDLVWRNSETQKLLIWKLWATQPIGDIIPAPDQAAHPNWTLVAALDFNLDGDADLLWYNTTTGKIVFWFMDQNVLRISGQFADPDSAGNANWKVVAAGDYGDAGPPPNGPDIVWRNSTSGKLVVWLMDAAGKRKSGVFTTPDAPAPALAWNVVGPR